MPNLGCSPHQFLGRQREFAPLRRLHFCPPASGERTAFLPFTIRESAELPVTIRGSRVNVHHLSRRTMFASSASRAYGVGGGRLPRARAISSLLNPGRENRPWSIIWSSPHRKRRFAGPGGRNAHAARSAQRTANRERFRSSCGTERMPACRSPRAWNSRWQATKWPRFVVRTTQPCAVAKRSCASSEAACVPCAWAVSTVYPRPARAGITLWGMHSSRYKTRRGITGNTTGVRRRHARRRRSLRRSRRDGGGSTRARPRHPQG